MIISASRRTDIPARFSPWLFNRLKEGYALVQNPMNPRQISRVDLSPEAVDGLVLWTKNPLPMLSDLSFLLFYLPPCKSFTHEISASTFCFMIPFVSTVLH